MPTVPWIRLYTTFPRHRKTMALRRILGTSDPILGLWCWASENAPDGDLSSFSVEELEVVAGWTGERGNAFKALCDVGFIDVVSDAVSANRFLLHEWADHSGAGISSYLGRRERQRDLMRDRRSGDTEDQREKKKKKKSVSTLLALTSADCAETAEAAPAPPASPTVLTFPCDGSPDHWGLTQELIDGWQKLYPSLDVMQESRGALAWILAQPSRRKTTRGMSKFLVGWLSRAQNSGPRSFPQRQLSPRPWRPSAPVKLGQASGKYAQEAASDPNVSDLIGRLAKEKGEVT
jgi:hypothetical protein